MSEVERVPSRLCVFAFECVCSWFRDFGSSLVSGESVKSVTDGSLEKSRTPSGNQSGSFTSRIASLHFLVSSAAQSKQKL